MSNHMIANLLDRVKHTDSESTILQEIARVANVQGRNARISYEAMAARCGFSVRWCIELVSRLEQRNLLRVTRTRISYAHCEINRYDIVVPWRRDLTYQEALERRQAYLKSQQETARLRSSERIAHRNPQQGEIPPYPPAVLPTEAMVIGLGRDPNSPFGRALMGLPDDCHEKVDKK